MGPFQNDKSLWRLSRIEPPGGHFYDCFIFCRDHKVRKYLEKNLAQNRIGSIKVIFHHDVSNSRKSAVYQLTSL